MTTMASVSPELRAAKEMLADRLLGSLPLVSTATARVSRAVAAAGRNVHAVGIGRKVVAGSLTAEPCVRIYVVQKIAKTLLSPRDLLPETVDGVVVDVIEAQRAYLLGARKQQRRSAKSATSAVASCAAAPRSRLRPIVPGISIAHYDVTAGTLGALCVKKSDGATQRVYVLSNNHVLANVNKALARDDVYQPGPLDGGTAADVVADLETFVPIALGATTANRVDCAIALLRSGVEFDPAICSIGSLGTPKTVVASEGLAVRKHGRTTGLTEGLVDDISYTAIVGMDHQDPSIVARFRDQLRIVGTAASPIVGRGGDSGSLVTTKTNPARAVGLYFAGPDDGTYGIANPIDEVTSALGIDLL